MAKDFSGCFYRHGRSSKNWIKHSQTLIDASLTNPLAEPCLPAVARAFQLVNYRLGLASRQI
jgi:hypothetical protein